jgi:formylglycine-generating enzyme required for sulfatase activity
MKKRNLICCAIALVCFFFTVCSDYENPIIGKWWEEDDDANNNYNPDAPVIITHPRNAVYTIGMPAKAMTVNASISNGGRLSYQWYSNKTDSNKNGDLISGATDTNYIPPTDQEGITYYYAVVTNTISDNNSSNGKTTVKATSNTAEIEVDVIFGNGNSAITITGLSVQDKVYDGTTAVTVTGTPVLNGAKSGHDVTIINGTAAFADANAGDNIAVVFEGWILYGTDANKYKLQMPKLTANIAKADPVISWPSGLTAVYGNTLSDIKLPDNGTSMTAGRFTWTRPIDLVGGRGIQSHNMTFTPNDTMNYNTITQYALVSVIMVKMVPIPAGTFAMGSNDNVQLHHPNFEAPLHVVTMSGFYMSEFVVTQDIYKAVIGSNPSNFKTPVTGENGTPGKLPVDSVSWYDAIVFCNKLSMMEGLNPAYRMLGFNNTTDPAFWGSWGDIPEFYNDIWDFVEIVPGSNGYRLPTEAQWEYACRAGTTTKFNTGETVGNNTGWYKGNSWNMTHKVGLKQPNAWGLYDMHGNVFEWCWDWFDNYTVTPQVNPEGPPKSPCINRTLRGGSWEVEPEYIRSSYRIQGETYFRNKNFGIRLVRPN